MSSPDKRDKRKRANCILDEWNGAHDRVRTAAAADAENLRDIATNIFMETDLIRMMDQTTKDDTQSFIKAVHSHYRDNSYHGFEHAIHVLCNAEILLKHVSLSFTSVERLALLFSALIHDLDHLGVSNNALSASSHPYALLYNDKSVAEMRSLTLAFELLQTFKESFYFKLLPCDKASFRKMVIDIVLSTDVADKTEERHFLSDLDSELLANENALDEKNGRHRAQALVIFMKAADVGGSLQYLHTSQFWCAQYYREVSKAAIAAGNDPIAVDDFLMHQLQFYSGPVQISAKYLQKIQILPEEFTTSVITNLEVNAQFWGSELGRTLLKNLEL